ncbi:MAG: hypothetical protein J6M08_06435 [Methanobrevibacter sp.]|nr:hypothetical protein [Methanobrevibacter sp.]
MISIEDKILSNQNFNVKFADGIFDADGKLNPGWAEPEFEDHFFIPVQHEPVLLQQSRVIPMNSAQYDLDDLEVELDFDAQRSTSTGQSLPLTSNETVPTRKRKQLLAQPLQAMTSISRNFLLENIEKEEFLTTYTSYIGQQTGPGVERFGIYADTNTSTQTGEATGFTTTNGILSQAKAIQADNTNDAHGVAPLVYSNNALEGLLDAAELYVEQDGDMKNANIVVPPQMYTKVVRDIATRETEFGDTLLKDGKIPMVMGMEVKQDNILRNVRHGWGTQKFDLTTGLFKGNGSNVDNLRYAFIGDPNNVAFGMLHDMEILNQWDIDILGYKVAVVGNVDAKIHRDENTLVVPFTKNAKSNA